MKEPSKDIRVSVVGLPGSGKTTFLAALWHLVQSGEVATRLTFHSLREGNYSHLNEIVKQWRNAYKPERTLLSGMKTVSMNLNSEERLVRITFPDVPGEDYQRMWEERVANNELLDVLSADGMALLINGDNIVAPAWVREQVELQRQLDDQAPDHPPVDWHPKHAPTQVQLVDLLQHVRALVGPHRQKLVVLISAWDKAEEEESDPKEFLRIKLPLLYQYLATDRDNWDWRAYGVSAQGGEYDGKESGASPSEEAARLRDHDIASKRIRVVRESDDDNDLTAPLEWLIN